MTKLVHIHPKDNVAVALEAFPAGTAVRAGDREIIAREEIPRGHKIALESLAAGEDVVKYGVPIGHAARAVQAGEWLHTHNVKTNLSGKTGYEYRPTHPVLPAAEPEHFRGYRRTDGSAAIRNEIWILPVVGCVNGIVKKLERDNQDLVKGEIEGLYAFNHPYGCSQTGEDHARTRKLLAALVRHPNAAAVLVVGLGCENLTREQFVEELGEYDPRRVKFMICQEAEDEYETGRALLRECAAFACRFKREEIPVSELVVGLKCGGSDGLSGITANPAVGRFSDLLAARGGTTILTEVPEMFGAESLLLNRCGSAQVYETAVKMIDDFKEYFLSHGEAVYENPSPGNKEGGITTLEDKSCGCVQKGGTAPIADVLGYADKVRQRGLNLLCGPGNDLVSATALTAAGAHMILFTTGRGTPLGAPAPTVKVATNNELYQKKKSWIDFNAGSITEGETIGEAGERLLKYVIRIAGGERTASERAGIRDLAIFKDGVTL